MLNFEFRNRTEIYFGKNTEKKAGELCRKEQIDGILAVGGGSVIDSAKGIAAGRFYEGDVWDLYMGKAELADVMPVGVVLTLPAAGSESSVGSVVTNDDGWLKRDIISTDLQPGL